MTKHIRITRAPGKWTVRSDGAVLVESKNALELSEGTYEPVIYFPRADIAMSFLDPSETTSTCPHKGEATYFSIAGESEIINDAGWSYENTKKDIAEIKDHIAFFSDKVTVEQI